MVVFGVLSRFAITIPKSCQDIPHSPWDYGMSSGFPCPRRDITVPLSFPSHCPKGTAGCPQDSHVPAQTSQSHCPSHPTVPRGLRDVLRTPMSQHRHHSPTVLPIPKSQGDCGMSSGLPCPSTDITVPLSFPSQSLKGTAGCPQDSHVPAQTSQSHCPSHPTVPRGLRDVLRTPMSQHRYHSPTVLPIPKSQGDCGMSSGLPCPSTDITVPLSFPSQSLKGTAGCPQDSHVPAQTSQSHCPSHPKVPRGLRDVLRTPMSQHRHHSPTVLPIPKSQGDCGMSSGLPCPSTDITVPLSFPSHCPKGTAGCPQDSHVPAQTSQSHCPSHPKVSRGLRDVLRTPMSQHRHHSPTVLPIPKSQGDCGMSSGLPCPSTDITVPLSFPSQSLKGTVGCPQDSHVPAQTSQSHCPSHPTVPRGLRDVLRTPMSQHRHHSPTVLPIPLSQRDCGMSSGLPLSQHRHHSPTVLPIPLSQGDCGMSSGLPCPSTDITVPLSFPSHCPKGTAGCPQDSHVPAQTSQSHCPSHPTVPRGLRDVLRTPLSHHRHHSPTVLPIPLSQGDCGMSSGLPCPTTDITVPLSFPSQSPKGTVGCPQDSRLTVLPISKFQGKSLGILSHN